MNWCMVVLNGILFCGIGIVDEGGKILLHETWEWTSGDFSSGISIIEEI